MKRREDWPLRLDRVICAVRYRPFIWGDFDCCLFPADAVDAVCGTEIAAGWRGRYKTAKGAVRLLRRAGGIDKVMAGIGPEIPPLMAQRADVVALPASAAAAIGETTGLILGICLGDRIASVAPDGLCFLPFALAERAWRIGE